MRSFALVCLAITLGAAAPAHADTLYDFSYAGGTLSASGSFTVEGSTITSWTGTADGDAITGILAGQDGSDQQFTASGNPAYFTWGGISFSTATENINLYGYAPGDYHVQLFTEPGDQVSYDTDVTLSITQPSPRIFSPFQQIAPTPEPSALGLIGTGLLSSAAVVRFRVRA